MIQGTFFALTFLCHQRNPLSQTHGECLLLFLLKVCCLNVRNEVVAEFQRCSSVREHCLCDVIYANNFKVTSIHEYVIHYGRDINNFKLWANLSVNINIWAKSTLPPIYLRSLQLSL